MFSDPYDLPSVTISAVLAVDILDALEFARHHAVSHQNHHAASEITDIYHALDIEIDNAAGGGNP